LASSVANKNPRGYLCGTVDVVNLDGVAHLKTAVFPDADLCI
jgi:hypothetical protein